MLHKSRFWNSYLQMPLIRTFVLLRRRAQPHGERSGLRVAASLLLLGLLVHQCPFLLRAHCASRGLSFVGLVLLPD